jgi:hypothetical protein
MSITKISLRSMTLACALCAALPAMAQSSAKSGDPARWSKTDKTKQQSMATLKKEINAAYAQQKTECGKQAKSERSSCLAQARQTYDDDMKNAPQLVAQAPTGGIQERTVTTVDSGGATAVGSSQGGSTASGSSQGGATASGDAEKGMEAGAAATGNSGSGITASGTASEVNATAAGDAAVGGTEPAKGMEPQAMQPPAVANPPRSEDTPIQR